LGITQGENIFLGLIVKLLSLTIVIGLLLGIFGVAGAQEWDYSQQCQEIEQSGFKIVTTGIQYGIPYAEVRIPRGFSINSFCRRVPSMRADFIAWRERIAFFNALNPFFIKTGSEEPFSIIANTLKVPLNLDQEAQIFPSVDPSLAGYEKYLVVDIGKSFLAYYHWGELQRVFPVSAGAAGKGTPLFDFQVQRKSKNHWSNIYDTWMPYALEIKAPYYIHGGALPGKSDSAGCIRMFPKNARELFQWVDVGTPGRIIETEKTGQIRSASLRP
jgi:hypothetical protein